MDFGLQGKCAIVTGGSKGIGKDIAKALLQEGSNVVICGRDEEALSLAERDLSQHGKGVISSVSVDLKTEQGARLLVDHTLENHGKIDILVNNVGGVERFGDFFDLTEVDWLDTFKLNIMSAVNCVRFTFKSLQITKGKIVNISSTVGLSPGAYNPHYTITKASMINLNMHLARRLAKYGICVNAICPGPVYSDSWDRNVEYVSTEQGISLEEARELLDNQEKNKLLLRQIGTGDDVAGLAVFLASKKANWITGSCFKIDGGKTC